MRGPERASFCFHPFFYYRTLSPFLVLFTFRVSLARRYGRYRTWGEAGGGEEDARVPFLLAGMQGEGVCVCEHLPVLC